MEDFVDTIRLYVAIVGAGPAGLMAGYCLAKKGRKVVIFERKLFIGGGMLLSGEKVARMISARLEKGDLD